MSFYVGRAAPGTITLLERFERFIERIPEAGCWIWMGALSPDGYGRFAFNGRNENAHRVSYQLATQAPIPSGGSVLHSCDVRCCVNPAHLRIGTQIDNMRDRSERNRAHNTRGEANPNAKLTAQAVAEIRSSTLPTKTLASQFRVSLVLICAVRGRRIWRHIP